MFQKKDIIYSETLGVCRVEEITRLVDKRGDTIMYYGLKALSDGKNAYIPIENHSVKLRELISYDDAKKLYDSEQFEDLEERLKFEIKYVMEEQDASKTH